MKKNLFRMLRSTVAMLLVFCMVAGFVPAVAFAEEAPAKKVVSLGDSMTNGLGLGGGYDSTGHQGFMEVDKYSYPALVADHYGWDLTQLATSCMRVEDLHYILDYGTENAYSGDDWTRTELLVNGRWYLGAEGTAAVFQDAVAEADVVIMGAGNCNIGVYLTDIVLDLVSSGRYGQDYSHVTLENALNQIGVDDQMKEMVMGIKGDLEAYLAGTLPEELADGLVDRLSYVALNYLLHFAGAMDRMVELNPDVEIVVVGLLNTLSGFEVDVVYGGATHSIDFAALYDILLKPLNGYMAVFSATKKLVGAYADAQIYYAKVGQVSTLAHTYMEEYAENEAFYLSRFVPEIISLMETLGAEDISAVTDELVLAYRNAVRSEQLDAFIAEYGMELVDAIEAYNDMEADLLNSVNQKGVINLDEGIYDENGNMTEGFTVALLGAYARALLANGMSAHPSKQAHRDICEIIKAAYDSNHTAIDQTIDNLKVLIGALMAEVEANPDGIIREDYYINENSYYVAIGDGTAASNSYVDALAAELGVAYKNLAKNGMMVSDVFDLLKDQQAEIEKADLITLGFGSNAFLDYTIDRAISLELSDRPDAEPVEVLDWEACVGEEGAAMVADALAQIYDQFVAEGLEVPLTYKTNMWGFVVEVTLVDNMAKLLTDIVESYAYAVTSYAFGLPKIVDEIHVINPDAVVAIVGMYNPVAGVSIDLDGSALEIGGYVDYLVNAANAHNLTDALLNENTIFVEATEVETQIEANGKADMDAMSFLGMYIDTEDLEAYSSGDLEIVLAPSGEATNPSAKGHEYIKTQICNALTEIKEVKIAASRMILGNELALQFAFNKSAIAEGVSYTAVITKAYADGRVVEVEVPQDQWGTSGAYYYVSFNGIAAKEMADEVKVQIFANGKAVSDVYADSIREYALRQLRKTSNAVTKTLYVDMLNYGAAAQTYFKYDAENLVNADLTDEEKAFGTESVNLENKLVAGTNYGASQLNLASSIQLRVKFNNINSSMKAVVKFTNHTGREIEVEVPGSEFMYSGTVVVVDEIVAADYAQDVTITVYNENGEAVANAVDSVASYIARMTNGNAIYDAVAKYTASAYAYLH